VSDSRAHVRRLAHRRGANFSLGFRLLPAAKRRAVYAAYAACRVPDDIVDEAGPDVAPAELHRRLDAWREEIEGTYARRPGTPATVALAEVLPSFPIPMDALLGLVEGCRMDLEHSRYRTFAELERYCELVAVTISDISLAIFGVLRAEAGRNPFDKALSALVGELSTRSEDFRTRWAAHNVHLHRTGTKLINHPVVGRLELMYDTLQLTADTGLTMLVYTAEPGSSTADALTLLASWAATPEQSDLTPATERR